jgi:hypothetical protein
MTIESHEDFFAGVLFIGFGVRKPCRHDV